MLQWLPVKPGQNNNTAKICQTIPKLAKQAFVLLEHLLSFSCITLTCSACYTILLGRKALFSMGKLVKLWGQELLHFTHRPVI